MTATILPVPVGAASVINLPRLATNFNPSLKEKALAFTSAVYSPRLNPARCVGWIPSEARS